MDGWIGDVLAMAAIRPAERVLVLGDRTFADEASDLAMGARAAGADASAVIWGGERPMRSPPPRLLRDAGHADVVIGVIAQTDLDEAAPRFAIAHAVTANGGRAILVAGPDAARLAGAASAPVAELAEVVRGEIERLHGARTLHISAPGGTDLRVEPGGRPWRTDVGPLAPRSVRSYPAGAIFLSPRRDAAHGVVVVDATIPGVVAGTVDAPVTITLDHGRVADVAGGESARRLAGVIEAAGEGARFVAEIGRGMHPGLMPSGHVLMDEKAAGAGHIALGRHTGDDGGSIGAAVHIDCVFRAARIDPV